MCNDTLVCSGFLLLMRKNWTPSEAHRGVYFWPAATVAQNAGPGSRFNFPLCPISWLFFPFEENLNFVSCERSFSSFCLSAFSVREKFPGSLMKIMEPLTALTFVKVLSLPGIGCLRKSHFSALPSDNGTVLASQPELLLPWVTYLHFRPLILSCVPRLSPHVLSPSQRRRLPSWHVCYE